MLHRRSSRDCVAPPAVTYMTETQMADYLSNLRTNRLSRPNGSRPPPTSSVRRNQSLNTDIDIRRESSSDDLRSSWTASRSSHTSMSSQSSEANVSERHVKAGRNSIYDLAPDTVNGGEGTEEDDLVMAAAQKEAEELIRAHQNPGMPYRLDALPTKSTSTSKDATQHDLIQIETSNGQPAESDSTPTLRKRSSYSKIAGIWGPITGSQRRRSSGRRSVSGKSKSLFANPEDKIYEDPVERSAITEVVKLPNENVPVKIEPQVQSAAPSQVHVRKNPFARVRAARNSSDQAIEALQPTARSSREVESSSTSLKESSDTSREPISGSTINEEVNSQDVEEVRYKDGIEVRSDELRAATSFRRMDRSPRLPLPSAVSDDARRPIVSFKPDWTPPKIEEINRSNDETTTPIKRPSPVPHVLRDVDEDVPVKSASAPAVPITRHSQTASAHPGNQQSCRPPSVQERHTSLSQRRSVLPATRLNSGDPSIPPANVQETGTIQPSSANIPPIPSISVHDDTESTEPSIHITIVGPSDSGELPPARQGPMSSTRPSDRSHNSRFPAPRPLPTHSASNPLPIRSRPLRSPLSSSQVRRATALCAQCALPISGKIVTAAGTRFHPDCFKCFTCATPLECVAFYPEPEQARTRRLDRIAAREADELPVDDNEAGLEEEDGDDSLRFYCHLDFHELFSPRCKSCKTPIEGEVVLACGAEWHVGHFFCAQCGDPFDSATPFVEKDGYAWCVGCHTRRFSAKCAGCRRPVTGEGVRAEGGEWHRECFACALCKSTFDDGRYYMVGERRIPICSTCQDMRLKE